MRHTFPKIFSLIALVTLLAGCGNRIQVEIPPKAPVQGIRTVAILPFDNVTQDPGLGYEFEDRIATALRQSGWYTSVTTQRVSSSGYTSSHSPEVARQIGAQANVDAVIVGTATYYFEDVYMSVPHCSSCNRPDRQPSWTTRQQTNVVVHLDARMIEVATGRELHARRSVGEDTNYFTHYLSWPRYEAPPASLVPNVTRQQLPSTRNYAIDRAVRDFTRDILPTYEWRSID